MASRAAARLLRDLNEVANSPDLDGVQAMPLEGNLFEWHVNCWMKAAENEPPAPIHLKLTFSDDYPSKPPSIVCFTPFPHANVVRTASGAFTLCLDMLEPPKVHSPYSGWSSAMSVHSILIQLQSFLTAKRLHYAEGFGSMARAQQNMLDFECKADGCPHRGIASAWSPQRPPHDQPPAQRRLVCRPCGTVELSAAPPAADTFGFVFDASVRPTASKPARGGSASSGKATSSSKGQGNQFAVLATEEDSDGDSVAAASGVTTSLLESTAAAAAGSDDAATSGVLSETPTVQTPAGTPPAQPAAPGKAHKKNMQRARKRERERDFKHGTTGTGSAQATPSNAEGDAATVIGQPASLALAEAGSADDSDMTALKCAGSFAILSYDVTIILMEKLYSQADVRSLICTCSYLRDVGNDGLLWRVLFQRHFPRSSLSAASLGDWKHTFALEYSNNADRLTCFHSKVELGSLDEKRRRPEILGIPLRFTTNPRTNDIDYVYSSLDTLSYSAFADDKVRRTLWGEKFTHFLPLYLSASHYQAAAPVLRSTIAQLCATEPQWQRAGGRFEPEMALDVLPKFLCTMIVLLVDKGVAASDVFLDGFVQIYRLLLALADEYPHLRTQVTKRVRGFLSSEARRSKQAEPSLGVLIPLLALANGLRWCDLAWPLLEEIMDRGVLWACRDHPELAKAQDLEIDDVLTKSWESRRVSNRLIMFSVGFLHRLSKLQPKHLDDFYGNPTPWLKKSMRAHVANVLAADSWPEFFRCVNVPLPTKAYMKAWIVRSVTNSERKRYHKRGMDFSRVQRSGVSAILRKGESVSASPTMKAVRLEQVWRYSHGTIYLDASALTYNFEGKQLAYVDYSSRQSATGLVNGGIHTTVTQGQARVALRHSGDVMNAERKEGMHTINIDLRALSDKVGSIFLTLSAWTTTLKEIVRPEVRCYDPDDKSGEPLARYELDGSPTGSHTSVVMARIWRPAPGKPWKVTAIGELGAGRAGNYGPIHKTIAKL